MGIITISESIKEEIARRVVDQAHPGYHGQGYYVVVNGSAVMFAQNTRYFNPWGDNDSVIGVNQLVFDFGGASQDNADFDPSPSDDVSDDDAYNAAVDFALGYVPDSYDTDVLNDMYGKG